MRVTASTDPVDKSYRKMISGMDLFERNRARAPGAELRFKLLPRKRNTDMARVSVDIQGETVAVPVRVAADQTFTLERLPKALSEDAAVQANRRAQTMTWRAEVRAPGLPPEVRRLGDLRLECEVGMEAELVSSERVFGLFGGFFSRKAEYCKRAKPRYLFFSERPLYSVTLVAGARRETLPFEMLYGDATDPDLKSELPFCDCEVLLERTYFLPLGDMSWPDDTLVEFEFMDDPVREAASGPVTPREQRAREAIVAGRSTKAEVAAALGPATSIAFDNGYEAWLYRIREPAKEPDRRSRRDDKLPPPRVTELVVLFAPAGVVAKARLRPPTPAEMVPRA